jgi:hypothetical protein
MKKCIRCGEEKPLEEYHKHKMMKGGRLNKCKACVVICVAEWREKNPEARKREYWTTGRAKAGIKETRKEFLKRRTDNAMGRKATSLKYAHKRRLQLLERNYGMTELDEFAFEEAVNLCKLREQATGLAWHVDHTVPLNHRKASGLHVAANFQVVPGWWNIKKQNRNMDEFNLSLLSAQ